MRLYLDFSARHFISGASSLSVLKALHQSKVQLYHAQHLHAKVVLINTTWFSVGSQNLTTRGQKKNLEASFIAGSDASSAEVLAFFKRVHKQARPITLGEIEAMEKLVSPWLAKFEAISDAATEIDSTIAAAWRARQRAAALAALRMRKARSQLKRFLKNSESDAKNHLIAATRTINHPWTGSLVYGIGKESTESLVPVDPRQNFETLFKGTGLRPRQLHRYLLVNEDTGQLGFVRFAKTRWTFFADGVSRSGTVRLGEHELRLDIHFDWEPSKKSPRNGVVTLHTCDDREEGSVIAKVDFALSSTGVELGEMECTGRDSALAAELAKPSKPGESARASLKKALFRQLTEPFVFKHNLIGREALRFFGHRAKFRVQRHLIGQSVIFSVRQISPS